ncbi:hypothetical protein ACKA04_04645 [Helcococcus kunzii]|uniref:hypothetical protein n=1 Tax=Helcococcus kunzii TaxID=40091 RepID=UPI0038A5358D
MRKNNYIYINTKRTRLNLTTFNENVVDSIVFMLAMMLCFGFCYFMLMVASVVGVK